MLGQRALAVLIPAAMASFASAQSLPRALRALEDYRTQMAKARIEWSDSRLFGGSGLRFYTSLLAPDSYALICLGDAQGVPVRASDGNPSTHFSGPQQLLEASDGQRWSHFHGQEEADLYPNDVPGVGARDLRSLGVLPVFGHTGIHETLWKNDLVAGGVREYREWTEDALHVISAQTDQGTLTWWLDPERAWSPVRVTLTEEGQVTKECRSTLTKYGDVWFPQSVAFYTKGYQEGREPVETVEIHTASFNQADHPPHLTPADIGITVGMPIMRHGPDRQVRDVVYWDGKAVITPQEYVQRVKSGELKPGSTGAASGAGSASSKPEKSSEATETPTTQHVTDLKYFESDWEAYTRRFIQKYKLEAPQAERAWRLLKDCQDQGNAYLDKHKTEFDHLEQRLRDAVKSQNRDHPESRAELRQRREELLKPITTIFEDKLKPRLETIPTPAQRAAAEAATKPTSQPKENGPTKP